jgi:hypothetical protein
VLALEESALRLRLTRPGSYRVAVRYSPYWKASGACVAPRQDGMTELTSPRAGVVALAFDVTVHRAFAALRGDTGDACNASSG